MQKSVEVEYGVIDEDGALAEPEGLVDATEDAEGEFVEPLLELKTPPCERRVDLRGALLEELDAVLARADELGKRLVPLGTPIDGFSIERLPGERARIQERILGRNFEYAKHCAGTHLHFEQRNVADQLNVLTALDPALALLNSSPYFRGARVADGARAYLYRRKCYEAFPDHGRLWEYTDTVAQWKRRLERRFDEFREAAVEAGVDGDAVDANFTSNDVVWTPVRLREAMPTVEWRSPDAALPSQTLQLVEAIDAVMEGLHDTTVTVDGERSEVADDGITLPEFDVVCDLAEAAMDDGVGSPAVAGYLDRMGFDVGSYAPFRGSSGGSGPTAWGRPRPARSGFGTPIGSNATSRRFVDRSEGLRGPPLAGRPFNDVTLESSTMAETAELSPELTERIESHMQEGETHEEFVEELLNHYESEGNLLWEGFGGEP